MLVYKIRNLHLSKPQKINTIIPFISSDEVPYQYDYTQKVSVAIVQILKQRGIETEEVGDWKLFLPFGRTNGELLGK